MANKQILVAAHSPLFGRSLLHMIKQGEYEVIQTTSPDEICSRYHDGTLSLCMIQDKLPDGSGLELCAELTQQPHAHPPPIIIFSPNSESQKIALQSGASGFLPVPCQPAQVLDIIKKWHDIEGVIPSSGEPAPAADATMHSSGRQTVLLVDDSKLIHTYVRNALNNTYHLANAYDGEEGYQKALEIKPDLIISDIDMPKVNGFEMCQQIKETESIQHIPILILSARGANVDIERGFAVGANDYLTKPVDENELRTRIELMLNSERRREKVLVIDDSLVQLNMIAQGVAQQGFEVLTAGNGQEGLYLAVKHVPDLIISDLNMPLMNGMELTRALKQRDELRDIPVIILTAYDSMQQKSKGMQSGVSAYLSKPFHADKVVVIVEKLLGDRRIKELEQMNEILEQKVAERTADLAEANGQLQAAQKRLELQVRELDGCDRLERLQVASQPIGLAYEIILEVVAEVLKVEQVVLYRLDSDGKNIQAVAAIGQQGPNMLADKEGLKSIPILPMTVDDSAATRTIVHSKPINQPDGSAAVPLMLNEDPLGALWVNDMPTEDVDIDVMLDTLWRIGRTSTLVIRQSEVNSSLDIDDDIDVSALFDIE
jgi:DNA-binding response OmpR family regulator